MLEMPKTCSHYRVLTVCWTLAMPDPHFILNYEF